METLQRNLTALMLEAFYAMPEKSSHFFMERLAGKRKKIKVFPQRKQCSLQLRKAGTTRWFHMLVNTHLLAFLVIGLYLPIPFDQRGLYNIVCLAIGWLFYFSMNRWVTRINSLENQGGKSVIIPVTGLQNIAGYNLITRLMLFMFLVFSMIAIHVTHITFALLTGFIMRWLIESQFLLLVFPFNAIKRNL